MIKSEFIQRAVLEVFNHPENNGRYFDQRSQWALEQATSLWDELEKRDYACELAITGDNKISIDPRIAIGPRIALCHTDRQKAAYDGSNVSNDSERIRNCRERGMV